VTRSEIVTQLQEEAQVLHLLYAESLAFIKAMMDQTQDSGDWSSSVKSRLHVLGYLYLTLMLTNLNCTSDPDPDPRLPPGYLYRSSEYAIRVKDVAKLWVLTESRFEVRECFYSWLRTAWVRHDRLSCFEDSVAAWVLDRIGAIAEASSEQVPASESLGLNSVNTLSPNPNRDWRLGRWDLRVTIAYR